MEGPTKVKRIYVSTDYEDIDLYDGDVDDFSVVPGQSVQPIISKIEPFKLKDVPHVIPVKEVDMWILSVDGEGEVDDSAISSLIDMNTWDYRDYMKNHFNAFPYINSLAIKKIRDAQMAADWINSKILMSAMAEGQEE